MSVMNERMNGLQGVGLLSASLLFTCILLYDCCSPDTEIVHSGAFGGSSFWDGRLENIVDCGIACVRRGICMGFNFDSGLGLCELYANRVNYTRRTKSDNHKTYSYIANWTISELDPCCSSRPCEADAVCMPGQFGIVSASCSYICINSTQLCPIPYSTFSGPRTIGSTYDCDGKTVECKKSREWNDTCSA